MTNITDRLDRLEAQLEDQQETVQSQQERIEAQAETIEHQRERLEEQAAIIDRQRERLAELDEDVDTVGDDEGDVIMNRRTAIQAGGVLGLLGIGAGAASADPQGQVGTQSDPLDALHTRAVKSDASLAVDIDSSNTSGSESFAVTEGGGNTDLVTVDQDGSVTLGGGLNLSGSDIDDEGTMVWNSASGYVPQARLENSSLDVAGNNVSLGGSTGVAHADLDSVTTDQHHAKDHDHTETGVSAVPNSGLENDSVTVNTGTGLTGGGSTELGDSTTLGIASDGVTGSEIDLASIAGDNITVDTANDALDAKSSMWADGDNNDLLEPSGTETGIEVTDIQTDTITDNGSGDVTMGASLDMGGNNVRLTEDFELDMQPGLDAVEFRDTNNGHTTFRAITGNPGAVDLMNANLRIRNGYGITDGFGETHLTVNGTGPLGVNKTLDLNSNDLTNAASINGSLTGDTEITDLVGNGLTINSNTLEATGSSLWTDSGDDGLLNPADAGDDGIGVTNVQTDNLTDNGSGDVTIGNSLDLGGNDVSISDSFNFHINTGSWPYVAFTDTNSQSEVRIDWDQNHVSLHKADFQIRNSGVVMDDTGTTHLTINSGGPLGVNQPLDLNANDITNAASINGSLTGNTEITDLIGSGLTINSGTLEATGGSSLWEDAGDDGLLNPSESGDTGIGVTNVQTDNLTDNGSDDVRMGNTLNLNANDVIIASDVQTNALNGADTSSSAAADQVMTTDGSGNLTLDDAVTGGDSSYEIQKNGTDGSGVINFKT